MDIIKIKNQITKCLRYAVSSIEVSEYFVSRNALSRHADIPEEIVGFQIIINNRERYHTFAVERDGAVKFTRMKEGISEHLTSSIRSYDFGMSLTNDIYQRDDVIGKFLEFWINKMARDVIEDTLTVYADAATRQFNTKHFLCSGFKVNRYLKAEMSFDALFEVLVRKHNETEWRAYRGIMQSGRVVSVVDQSTNMTVSLDDVFA